MDFSRVSAEDKKALEWFKINTPPKLCELVELGRVSIEANPNHHLELGIREAIYMEMGPWIGDEAVKDKSGYYRRVELAKLSLEKVLPIWDKSWPGNDLTKNYMEKFKKVMDAESFLEKEELVSDWADDNEKMCDFANNTWLRDKEHKIHRLSNAMVGIAIVSGIILAGKDAFLCSRESNLLYKDKDIDNILHRDLHYFAAFAYAGGLPCIDGYGSGYDIGDKNKLREFWKWWLLEALPVAWIKNN